MNKYKKNYILQNNIESKNKNYHKKIFVIREAIIKNVLKLFSIITILITVGIILTLLVETISFFQEVSFVEFFTSSKWTPLLRPKHYGVIPLLYGTLLIALGSSLISFPLGLGSAVYLSHFAPKKVRRILKPILEILAGIPSIVYGFFALIYITPVLQKIFPHTEIFNAASAFIAVGIMIMPTVASISEDGLMNVPRPLREGAYALGSTKLEVLLHVSIPTAFSTIVSSFILAISRAIGETMIVAIAAGANPRITLNPLESIQTMTGYMVNISLGDIPHGTIEYKTVFVVGSVLFIMTFIMNIISKHLVKRFGRSING